jgi:hypothetical protein
MRNVPRGRTRYPGAIEDYGNTILNRISDCVVWFDANQITGKVEDDPIGTLTDYSGNFNDAAQATESYQPLYKTNIANGKPGLLFDGSNDWMISPFGTLLTTTSFTLVYVFKTVTDVIEPIFRDSLSTANQGTTVMPYNYAKDNFYRINNTPLGLATSSPVEFGPLNMNYVIYHKDGINAKAITNGSLRVSKTLTDALTVGDEIYFAKNSNDAECHNHYFFEYMLFNKALSSKELGILDGYLKGKWGIT